MGDINKTVFLALNRQLRSAAGVGETYSPAGGMNLDWLRYYAPPEAENIDDIAYVALPAIGASAVILSRTIDPGYNAIFASLANNFVGGGWTEGSGAVAWQILVDGAALPGYDSIPASLGSPANPVYIPGRFRVYESSTIQLVVTNVNVVLAGQLSGGRWQGYFYPKEYEDPNFGGQ